MPALCHGQKEDKTLKRRPVSKKALMVSSISITSVGCEQRKRLLFAHSALSQLFQSSPQILLFLLYWHLLVFQYMKETKSGPNSSEEWRRCRQERRMKAHKKTEGEARQKNSFQEQACGWKDDERMVIQSDADGWKNLRGRVSELSMNE